MLHDMLADPLMSGKPLLIFANKQDLPKALKAGEVRKSDALQTRPAQQPPLAPSGPNTDAPPLPPGVRGPGPPIAAQPPPPNHGERREARGGLHRARQTRLAGVQVAGAGARCDAVL